LLSPSLAFRNSVPAISATIAIESKNQAMGVRIPHVKQQNFELRTYLGSVSISKAHTK
jgi:hypothetical protein